MRSTCNTIGGLAAVLAVTGGLCSVEEGIAATGNPTLPAVLVDCRTLLFYGDSLTDGSSYPDFVVNSLNDAFPEAGFLLENSAKCGDTTRNLLERWEADVIPKKPDLISICIGANDVAAKISPEEYEENLRMLVERAQKKGMKVVLFLSSHYADQEKDAALQILFMSVKKLAAEYRLPVADAHGVFKAWEKEGKEVLGADGLHHGKDGFQAMARAFLDGIGLKELPLKDEVTPWPGALTSWEVSDPIPMSTNSLEAQAASVKQWNDYNAQVLAAELPWWDKPFLARGGVMPLIGVKQEKGEKFTVLARVIYEAKAAGEVELKIGGSAPLRILLNGQSIWTQKAPHGYHPGADSIPVQLVKGRNTFVVQTEYMAFLNLL